MKNLMTQAKDTLREIPGVITAIFILSVVLMNLFANKSLFNTPWLVCDAGTAISWIPFLCMDIVCKRFGAKAGVILNTFGMIISLAAGILMMVIIKIPGIWSASYDALDSATSAAINAALDSTFSSPWYVIIGSAAAMFCGGAVNSAINKRVGTIVDNKHSYKGFLLRSGISTAIGQFVDNIVFATFVSLIFFGWTVKQVFICSIFMMLVELVFEMIFTPVGYLIIRMWERENVGDAYRRKYMIQ